MNVEDEFLSPPPEDTQLAVNIDGPENLIIDDVEHWKASTSRRTGAVVKNIPVSGRLYLYDGSRVPFVLVLLSK